MIAPLQSLENQFSPTRTSQNLPTACVVSPAEARRCQNYPPALSLLIFLRQNSGALPFSVVPETVAPNLCMSAGTARAARDYLLRAKLILSADSPHPPRGCPGRRPRMFQFPLNCQTRTHES
jgi:hypothetical protein